MAFPVLVRDQQDVTQYEEEHQKYKSMLKAQNVRQLENGESLSAEGVKDKEVDKEE